MAFFDASSGSVPKLSPNKFARLVLPMLSHWLAALHEHCAYTLTTCISDHLKMLAAIRRHKDWTGREWQSRLLPSGRSFAITARSMATLRRPAAARPARNTARSSPRGLVQNTDRLPPAKARGKPGSKPKGIKRSTLQPASRSCCSHT